MSITDWLVLLTTLGFIILYGVIKGRGQKGALTFLLADKKLPGYMVLLGVMSTQASAITFLSAPGQAFTDGMRFVQYYFGLPIAMVVICVTFIPVFQKLGVYTAYEYLEQRFDTKTRRVTAILFLLSRGLSTGISIYAPSIVLSSILGWNIYITNALMGGLLIIYTCSGGAKAIAHTQKLQFVIILASMAFAGFLIVKKLPGGTGLGDALYVAGKAGRLNVITTDFGWKDKYNIWSGIIGGFFLALSYFGTDQSQVGRYITARDADVARKGLLWNGVVKIPMQFAILLIGALLFAFYSLRPAPLYFNEGSFEMLRKQHPEMAGSLEAEYQKLCGRYQNQAALLIKNRREKKDPPTTLLQEFGKTQHRIETIRNTVKTEILRTQSTTDAGDTNYIFLYFVKNNLPKGLVGLLFAVIFLASWGSISAALNALTASSMMDLRSSRSKQDRSEAEELYYGRLHTVFWGLFSIAIAMFATRMGSLIEAVNILGSLFYGTILGIFLVAFYLKSVKGGVVFFAAIIAEIGVAIIYYADVISFLWLNLIGAMLVVLISVLLSFVDKQKVSNISQTS